jgi:predicted dehydrogenase/aryl-alcohol dehydrogenase-like predicted oxidoreductase
MKTKMKWGILGAGRIAGSFAKGLKQSATGELSAVGSRDQGKADVFGKEHGAKKCYGAYESLLADKEVQAIYVATPHPMHAEWTLRALEAGKHVLCEKPIGINHAQAMVMFEIAQKAGKLLMEAFMYRCHPQTLRLVELIREKAIGEVRLINACFSFGSAFNPESRLFNNGLGGGGILDVGGYPMSMARLLAGAAMGNDFAEPIEVKGAGLLGQTGVDEIASAVLKFPGGILAELTTGIIVGRENSVRVYCSEGEIIVPEPWTPTREAGKVKIILKRKDEKEAREIIVEAPALYGIEADAFAFAVEKGRIDGPAMGPEDSLGNMRALDLWRESIGLVYESEKAPLPVSGNAPVMPLKSKMKYGTLPGINKKISRLIMGVDNQKAAPHAFAMFDDFIERGGNCFDCAWVYAGGACEKVLGNWVKTRGLREQVVILDKGAHTPFCNPDGMTRQFLESLARLQMDYMDIYMLHRDNPEVPAGEFAEALNEHLKAGRMRAFGVSNWTLARVDAFNAYAKSHGLIGISAVSNQFSLARMVDPVWAGCLSASDKDSRQWFEHAQMALLPWSSQARGFFIPGRARPDDHSDKELSRSWYAPDNFQRLERVNALAKKRGVLPINIALAYVLCQPFPTFPLIGPRLISETRTSFQSLDVGLSTEEVRWLNLENNESTPL